MKLGHVHIKVRDIEKSKEYYIDILGMHLVEEIKGQFAFLSFDSAHHDLALQQSGNISGSHSESVLYHIAFEVQDVASLKNVKSKLESNGYKVSAVDHGISWALYTYDPDGNGVEIYMDRRNAQEGSELWHGHSKQLVLS